MICVCGGREPSKKWVVGGEPSHHRLGVQAMRRQEKEEKGRRKIKTGSGMPQKAKACHTPVILGR